ncbi:MAG: CheR family methyltransferase, partial [Planctomycetota bacterium]|nr:CheR family methyltransferase [Planctomycetota bacterium]
MSEQFEERSSERLESHGSRRRRARAATSPVNRDGAKDADVRETEPDVDRHRVRDGLVVVGVGAGPGGGDGLIAALRRLEAREDSVVLALHTGGDDDEVARIIEAVGSNGGVRLERAADGAAVRAGAALIAPAGCGVVVEDATLRVRRLDSQEDQGGAIDALLHSIAAAHGPSAIGVVCGGRGADGAFGLKSVRDQGGIAYALIDDGGEGSITEHAASSGVVDRTLSAEALGREISAYAAHAVARAGDADGDSLRDEILERLPQICEAIEQHTEQNFRHYKSSTLMRRVMRRMQLARERSADSYVRRLQDDRDEAQALFRDILIGVTAFFRDPEAFEALRERVIPELLRGRSQDDPVRVWVVGCASGEEAYSLAMLFREALDELEDPPGVQIFGTDLNERALQAARAGEYPLGSAEQMSEERLTRFFVRKGRSIQVSRRLREMCLFSLHNLISDPPFSKMDLIACRNVLIYMGPHLQQKLPSLFHFALREGGHLFLGPTESVTGHESLFEVIDARRRILRRKDAAA